MQCLILVERIMVICYSLLVLDLMRFQSFWNCVINCFMISLKTMSLRASKKSICKPFQISWKL